MLRMIYKMKRLVQKIKLKKKSFNGQTIYYVQHCNYILGTDCTDVTEAKVTWDTKRILKNTNF